MRMNDGARADGARSRFNEWRDRLAVLMGVGPGRKENIYLQIARSASLRDVTYWLRRKENSKADSTR